MIAIRLATPDDLPAIEEVMRASMAAIGARYYDAQQTASAVTHIAVADRQLIDDGTYFVVTEGDRVVACGGWSPRKKLFTGTTAEAAAEGMLDPATDAARVRAMFVHPDYARRGLGRMILDASEQAARRAGFTRFELMATLPGVPLYEACGYEVVERVTNELPDGTMLETVRM
ncbi:MAG TPA: GNAT family N-acetyltransferase, partial [Thermoanaerobaculia bacterium]|nr:GNAT family N-acetyltransferase [Thermoanaerobaculia bacterium]